MDRARWVVTAACLVAVSGCFDPDPSTADMEDMPLDASSGEAPPSADPTSSGTGGEEPDPTNDPGDESTGDMDDLGSCGDGIVQGGEECDLGADNLDTGACTTTCTIAVCGDGFVHAGAEACDDAGPSASCDDDCTVPVCGDGVVNPLAFEQCDGDGDVMNGHCVDCVAECDPGWSRCGGGPAAPCNTQIDSAQACDACGHSWRVIEVTVDEHATVDDQFGGTGAVAMIESAMWETSVLTGWLGFDVGHIDDPLLLEQARLRMHVVYVDGGPVVDVVADPSTRWAPEDFGPGATFLRTTWPQVDGFPLMVDLDLEVWDWQSAFAADWANFGLQPTGPAPSVAHFDGKFGAAEFAPTLELVGCFQ